MLNPQATAAATDNPTADDFPLPLAAVNEMIFLELLLLTITSTKVMIALAWSRVLALETNAPIIYLCDKSYLSLESYSFALALIVICFLDTSGRSVLRMLRMLSSSSRNRQFWHLVSESKNLSLNLGSISWNLSVLYLWWTSIAIVCNCLSPVIVFNIININPPPSTVYIVRHKTLGVSASKSCRISIWYVFPSTLWVYL